jgi:hypothetical protein
MDWKIKMEKLYKQIHNAHTNEIIVVELTAEDYADLKQRQEAQEAQIIAQAAEAKTKAEAKASAYSKLEALGLSADDIEALGLVKSVIQPTELPENL